MNTIELALQKSAKGTLPAVDEKLFLLLLEKRKKSVKDLYLVFGQLGSTTNEPIDSITFFKWLIEHNIPAKYVLWEQHPQAQKLEDEGYGSSIIKLHGNAVGDCEFLHACFNELVRVKAIVMENNQMNPRLRHRLFVENIGEQVFLQHGTTYTRYKQAFENVYSRFDFVNVSSKVEKEFLEKNIPYFQNSKHKPYYFIGGLPRWELLKDESSNVPPMEKVVFVMPTWRPEFNHNASRFENSIYYKQLKVLFSKENVERLEALGMRFVFAPHHHLMNFVEGIHFEFPVEIASTQQISYWIRHASCCITDFSSVSFDFHFLEKPVIYWNLDSNDETLSDITKTRLSFVKEDLEKLQFVRAKTIEKIFELLTSYAQNNFQLTNEQKAIVGRHFEYKTNISEKIFEGIENAIFLKNGRLQKVIQDWMKNVPDDSTAITFDNLIQKFTPKEVISVLAESLWSNIPEIVQKIKNCESLKTCSRKKIKTIAFYYCRISNGGAERVTADLCNLFSQLKDANGNIRYRILLITDDAPTENEFAINSIVTRKFIPNYVKSIGKNYRSRAEALTNILDKENIDLFVTGLWTMPCTSWDILTIKTHKSHPAVVIHSHGFCAITYHPRYNAITSSRICANYQLSDGVACLSDLDKYYIKHFCKNVSAILNPLPFKITDRSSNFEQNTVLWIGRLSPEKRPLHALLAMREVIKKIPEAKLYLVGTGSDRILAEIKIKILEFKLEKNVILPGFTLNPEQYYSKVSCLLSTSEFEGFSLTFVEAKSFSLPVISYNYPNVKFICEKSGMIIIPQDSPKLMGEAIVDLLRNPKKSKQIGLEGKKRLIEMYANGIEKDWEKLFDNCFNKNAHLKEKIKSADTKNFDKTIQEYILKWSKNPRASLKLLNDFGFNFKLPKLPDFRPMKTFLWPKILVRIVCFFIWDQFKRKNFRERHMDLRPKDGIDIHSLSQEQLRKLRCKKKKNRWYQKLFDSIIPATRSKIQHSERHILEEIARQNAFLRNEIRELKREQQILKEKIKK